MQHGVSWFSVPKDTREGLAIDSGLQLDTMVIKQEVQDLT
jgi:hypothetical protein